MKKILTLALALLMSLSLVACSSPSGEGEGTGGDVFNTSTELKDTLSLTYTSDPNTLDYLTSVYAIDFETVAPLVDGLLGYDKYGHIVGNLAETWEHNEDMTEWTFHLRQGVNWVTNTGEVYAEVTADDFVAALQHAADFKSGTIYLLYGDGQSSDSGLVGLNDYLAGTVDFDAVGVKATDTYTVTYTFNDPVPYMESMATYGIMYPVNRTFLESQGEGCALGSPNVDTCNFGSVSPDSILYNGSHLLSALDAKSQIRFTKNENYYNADEVYVNEVTWIYAGEEQDVYSTIVGFENGTYDQASLSPVWEDFDDYVAKYDGYYYESLPNAAIFGTNFNYNRSVYEHTAHADEASQQATQEAIHNVNFRNAVLHAFDRVAYLAVQVPEDMAVAMLRNFNGNPDIVVTSDGRTYGELVSEAYSELVGEEVDLSDGQDPFLNKEKALEYIELAKADGIEFPIYLDLAYINNASEVYLNRAQSMKNSIEENTDGQIVVNLIGEDIDTYQDIQYYNSDPTMMDYDINTFSGWSPDYTDPKTYTDIYSTTTGTYMKTLGLPLGSEDTAETAAIKEEVGLTRFEELYRAADAITDDMDARYEAFAEADAWLVAQALMLPSQMDTRGYVVTRVVPFTKQYSQAGLGEYKFVGMQVQEGIVTREQYDAAYEDFSANR